MDQQREIGVKLNVLYTQAADEVQKKLVYKISLI